MTDAEDTNDPRSAEPVAAPPYEEEPSTTGVVAEGGDQADSDSSPSTAVTDQQAALEQAVEQGEAEGSAASGA